AASKRLKPLPECADKMRALDFFPGREDFWTRGFSRVSSGQMKPSDAAEAACPALLWADRWIWLRLCCFAGQVPDLPAPKTGKRLHSEPRPPGSGARG